MKVKIYRCTVRRDGREHDGYVYYSKKSIAEAAQAEENAGENGNADEVTEIEYSLTKKGVLDLLNTHASYPDNG